MRGGDEVTWRDFATKSLGLGSTFPAAKVKISLSTMKHPTQECQRRPSFSSWPFTSPVGCQGNGMSGSMGDPSTYCGSELIDSRSWTFLEG